jgi:putative Holliday junction resolvase
VDIPVVFQDETMSSKEAEILSIQANIRRKKRRRLKDAYSAVVILQNYLDSRR